MRGVLRIGRIKIGLVQRELDDQMALLGRVELGRELEAEAPLLLVQIDRAKLLERDLNNAPKQNSIVLDIQGDLQPLDVLRLQMLANFLVEEVLGNSHARN